jgi:hypothetical protein
MALSYIPDFPKGGAGPFRPTSLMIPYTSFVRLLWSPFSLADISRRCSTGVAAVVGLAILCLQIGFILSSEISVAAEPFPSFGNYLEGLVFLSLIIWIVLAAVCALVSALVIAFCRAEISEGKSLSKYIASRISETKVRIILLGHVPLLLPILAWSFANASVQALPDAVEFYGPGGKPDWISSPIILLISSPLWLLLTVVALILIYGIANIRLQQPSTWNKM